jgi:hypothetical protein
MPPFAGAILRTGIDAMTILAAKIFVTIVSATVWTRVVMTANDELVYAPLWNWLAVAFGAQAFTITMLFLL